MKVLVQRMYASPNYTRVLEWGKLLSITGGAQLSIQAISLVSGILVIRLLPTQEYALYTLANMMLGTMVVLADGGITAGVLSQGGKVWQDREQLGTVLATGLELRKMFAVGSLLIAVPILFYLLLHHGASWLMSALLVLALIPTFITALSNSLLEIAPKLRQDIFPLQRNELVANSGRLVLLVVSLFAFPWAYVAVFASSLPQLWANRALRKISATYADWYQLPNLAIRQEILKFVKRVLPGSIYYCLSSQITIWLISVFGSTAAIAQIGALGRLAVILNVFSTVFTTLLVPRFARLPNQAKLLLSRYLQLLVGLAVLSTCIIGLVWLFPSEVLWILGRSYANLKFEVVLNIINACLGLIAGASFAICTSRGWIIHPLVSIPVTIGAIIGGILLLDISTLRGILTLNIFVMSVEIFMYVVHTLLYIKKAASFNK